LAGPRLWAFRQAWYRWALRIWESLTLPGIQLHYALRKQMIERIVRREISAGCRKVKVIGAGFDTLALRLAAQHRQVMFIEADHPSTQKAKQRCLVQGVENLSFQALDLDADERGPGSTALEPGPPEATVVVAEGVLMYLEPSHVRRFFEGLRHLHPGPLTVVFTFMTPDEKGGIRFHRSSRYVDWWLKWKGEPFRWGIAPSELGGVLSRSGYRLLEIADDKVLRDQYLKPLGSEGLSLAVGESLAVAKAER
jgi:methyltransferase (TIGR00027 family)